jgi:superfamily II DNA or RNA helicase
MIRVKKIHKIPYNGDTYNLHVRDNHNYFCDNILVSNCHGAKSYEVNLIGKKCINADHRFGFTGTLSKLRQDNLNIQSVLGPKIFDLKSKDLIEEGILSKISIANILLEYTNDIKQLHKNDKYKDEVKFISEYSERNKIFNWIFDKMDDGDNSLILCRTIKHIKNIEKYLLDNLDDKYKVFVIYGEIKAKEREKVRLMMEQEKNMVIISNYQVFSTGINIKRLHHVILASSLKSEITLPQTIGRGLRTHPDKDRVIIWDIIDDWQFKHKNGKIHKNYIVKHFNERLKLYKEHSFNFVTMNVKLIDIQI